MKLKLKYLGVTFALFVCLGLSTERRAYAYTDPGSTLLIFQSLSAVFSGGLFYFRKRLKSLIVRSKEPEKQLQPKSERNAE
jgi:hypothetical protein